MKRLIGFAVILILVVLVQGCQALQPALDDWKGKNMQMSSGPCCRGQ